jgi:hypothetical protein
MEVSGQLQAPAASAAGKELPVPVAYEALEELKKSTKSLKSG